MRRAILLCRAAAQAAWTLAAPAPPIISQLPGCFWQRRRLLFAHHPVLKCTSLNGSRLSRPCQLQRLPATHSVPPPWGNGPPLAAAAWVLSLLQQSALRLAHPVQRFDDQRCGPLEGSATAARMCVSSNVLKTKVEQLPHEAAPPLTHIHTLLTPHTDSSKKHTLRAPLNPLFHVARVLKTEALGVHARCSPFAACFLPQDISSRRSDSPPRACAHNPPTHTRSVTRSPPALITACRLSVVPLDPF